MLKYLSIKDLMLSPKKYISPLEPQLMPQTNRVFNCPGFTDGYRYTKLPFACDTRYDK